MQQEDPHILVIEDNPEDFLLVNEYLAEAFRKPVIQHAETLEKGMFF